MDPISNATLPQSNRETVLQIHGPALLEAEVRANLPIGVVEWIHGSAADEVTMKLNVERLREHLFHPKRLAGFSSVDTSVTIFGRRVAAPMFVCPMGAQDIVHADAEIASATGAQKSGIPYVLTSASNRSIEEVAKATPGAFHIFALYSNQDSGIDRDLLTRAREAEFVATMITVDTLGPGESEAYRAMGSPHSPVAGYGNFDPRRGGRGTFQNMRKDLKPADVERVKRDSKLPLLVKGILRPDDALRALAAGADGVVVSNHGGRSLDGAPAAIDALPAIVDAVGDKGLVWFDSGVRRGTDVVRAIALGASVVGVGRPVLDALALGGASGVASLLQWFRNDVATAMLLVGIPRITELTPDILSR
jgi:L-lactate oxidase